MLSVRWDLRALATGDHRLLSILWVGGGWICRGVEEMHLLLLAGLEVPTFGAGGGFSSPAAP